MGLPRKIDPTAENTTLGQSGQSGKNRSTGVPSMHAPYLPKMVLQTGRETNLGQPHRSLTCYIHPSPSIIVQT